MLTHSREVNTQVRQLAEMLPDVEPWRFLCECSDDDCHCLVTLDRGAYDRIVAAGDAVTAAGHLRSQAADARAAAAELRDDSAALVAQAEQIVRKRSASSPY